MMKFVSKITVVTVMLLFSGLALAHTSLKESTPADGATLSQAPAAIDLVFNADVRLIKFEVRSESGLLKTEFQPMADSRASYSIVTPAMTQGRYTVNWAAIAPDGHTMTNSFSFTVDSSAVANSAP